MKNGKIVIIGGGLSGLAAAYELANNYEIVVFEKEDTLGGLASSHMIHWDGKIYHIAKTYHHILEGDVTTIQFIENFGLENKFHRKKVKQGFIYQNKILGFSSPLEIITFPTPLVDKLRLAKFMLIDSKKDDWSELKGVNAKDWIISSAGKKNFEIFFDHLIRNKFHESAEVISAPWLGTRFSKESTSFLKKFGWLEGGIVQLIDKFADNIKTRGGKIYTGAKVVKVTLDNDCSLNNEKEILYEIDGKTETTKADIIINTAPPEIFLELIDNKREFESLSKIGYLSCICSCLGLNKQFTNLYWINILDDGLPFSAIFNHTALYEDASPIGKSVFYIITYLNREEELWSKSNEEIIKIYLENINNIIPRFKDSIEWWKIKKFKYAEAKYYMGFENPPISIDDIYFAGIYRIYPKIRNMATAIESGLEVAKKIKDLKNK